MLSAFCVLIRYPQKGIVSFCTADLRPLSLAGCVVTAVGSYISFLLLGLHSYLCPCLLLHIAAGRKIDFLLFCFLINTFVS